MDDSLISDLLMETKSRKAYPPQKFGEAFLTSPARSKAIGLTMQAVPEHAGQYCLGLLNEVLEEFVEALLHNPAAFGLNSKSELEGAVLKNVESEFTSARGRLVQEFQMMNEGRAKFEAMSTLDEGHGKVIDNLCRKIRLHATKNFPVQAPSIQVTGSQNVNIVLGSVNTSIQNLIAKGGPEKEAAKLIDELVNIVKELDAKHEKEKADLLNLAQGLAKEIEKEAEHRNPSVMSAVLDRIRTVGSAISTATALHKFITELLPQLAHLLGIGG
jgi:hypothetical protein